ncbi:hypothetical protein DFJ77DRAFT_452381 [Powellomyces hirtus]|nr:hypothetical protein DFJ77DRAFT_452381 [Powellomyces hirtus]
MPTSQLDPYMIGFAVAYLFVWANYVYALFIGMLYQIVSALRVYRRRRLQRVVRTTRTATAAASSAPTIVANAPEGPLNSPTPANPTSVEEDDESTSPATSLRMPLRTALVSWVLCLTVIAAFGLLPYFLYLGPTHLTPGGIVRVSGDKIWEDAWETYSRLYDAALRAQLQDLPFIPFVFVFIVINREILILCFLSMFCRWPKRIKKADLEVMSLAGSQPGSMKTARASPSAISAGPAAAFSSSISPPGTAPMNDVGNADQPVPDTLSGPFERYRQSATFSIASMKMLKEMTDKIEVDEGKNSNTPRSTNIPTSTYNSYFDFTFDSLFADILTPITQQRLSFLVTPDGVVRRDSESPTTPETVMSMRGVTQLERPQLAGDRQNGRGSHQKNRHSHVSTVSSDASTELDQGIQIHSAAADASYDAVSDGMIQMPRSTTTEALEMPNDVDGKEMYHAHAAGWQMNRRPSRKLQLAIDRRNDSSSKNSDGQPSTATTETTATSVPDESTTNGSPISTSTSEGGLGPMIVMERGPLPPAVPVVARSRSAGDLLVMGTRSRRLELMREGAPSLPGNSKSTLAVAPDGTDTAEQSSQQDHVRPISTSSNSNLPWVMNRSYSTEQIKALSPQGYYDSRDKKQLMEKLTCKKQPGFARSSSLSDLASWSSAATSTTGPAAGTSTHDRSHGIGHAGMRHAIIIACHNSSEVLRNTLTHLLKLVQPRAIFLADNGSSDKEVVATKAVAAEFTDAYRKTHPNYLGTGINIGVLKKGSKTIAQFSVLNSLAHLKSDIEFVSLLDDDTTFPETWSEQYIMNMFANDLQCHCLAYPIEAERGNGGVLLENFQNFEYRISMFIKIAQATIRSAFFPSGAVSTWRAATLLDILSRHDTMFRGDDLQMGLIMHTLYGEVKYLNPEEVHTAGYSIKVAPYSIPTLVPVHWLHLKDLFPKVYWKHLPSCECGEPSLFYQRARSWEVARHRFFWKFVRVAIHAQKWNHWSTWFAKLCAIDAVTGILNDFVQIAMVFYIVFVSGGFLSVGLLTLESLAFQMAAFHLLNLCVLNRSVYTSIPIEIRTLYPIFYMLPINILVKHAAMVYNYLHYTPMVRNEDDIGTQARKRDLQMMDVSWSPRNLQQEQLWLTERVAKRVKEVEKSKRFWASQQKGPLSGLEIPAWEANPLPMSPVVDSKPRLLDVTTQSG